MYEGYYLCLKQSYSSFTKRRLHPMSSASDDDACHLGLAKQASVALWFTSFSAMGVVLHSTRLIRQWHSSMGQAAPL